VGVAIVIMEHATQPLSAGNGSNSPTMSLLRINEFVAQPLMWTLRMIILVDELSQCR
jgi:hypothetical protein